ncbi:MAG TPA: hypothetical protein VFL90_09100, partial [Methylomirabilota bacterium]|nr:hypothetical protein [Methylomirabilota bacterium]
MRPRSSATYFAASIVLLIAVIAVYAGTTARRTQAALRAQLEDKGLALAEAFETSSRHAIRSNALLEEALARRLFDDARLVDELLQRPVPADAIAALAQRTGLRRIDLLDREGRPWTPPAPPPMAPGMRMGSAPMPGMMRFMWGRRWAPAPESAAEPPRAVRDRRFWQGTVFGVAIGARSFDGVIAVHADADDVLSFRREVGVQRQLEELARLSGVVAVAVLGADRAVLASAGALAAGV